MILDDTFDRVVVISLPRSPERAERALRELREKNLSERAVIHRGIDGKLCPPTDWWQAGAGAWGCMMSHMRAVQDALMDGLESLLVIEDDCVWQRDAAEMAAEFLAAVPDDWGQIYLGGQHRASKRPEWLAGKPSVMRARSIHRTHAYAIHRRAMAAFLKHILYAPDYLEAKTKQGVKRHVDHQLEYAQQRGDWPVYCPSWWLAGQGENLSLINGNLQREQWWQISWQEAHRKMPLVILDVRPPLEVELRYLHCGKHLLEAEPWVDTGIRDAATPEEMLRLTELVAAEALGCQRLPAVPDLPGGDPRVAWLKEKWLGPVILLSSSPDLPHLCDFRSSKVIEHGWLNPRQERRQPVGEASASTEESARLEQRPRVHQVWIGGAEMPPRLEGYCRTVRRGFPEWEYKLWTEEDMEGLARQAVLPEVVRDASYPLGLRADIIRLEILRQHGGVYLDTDFEALRPDLGLLFTRPQTFYYGDEKSGRPSNAFMAAPAPYHPFVEFYLRRIAATLRVPENLWDTVGLTGPGKISECLGLWVVDWKREQPLEVTGARVGSLYAGGTIAALWKEILYPYHYQEGTWATFDPEAHPQAWAAHHWEGGWHRNEEAE